MARVKFKFRLHRTAIVLICLVLLVLLMQGASYFSLSHQLARSEQVDELAQTLAKQVTFSLLPIMDSGDNDIDSQKVDAILQQLTQSSRILDASVYQIDGTLVASAGENVKVRDRLSLDGKRPGSYFNHQIVELIPGKSGPNGFLRMTLDTHVLVTESKQVDNTTNLLRLMILVALVVGIILARTLLQGRRIRWQQSPYLLTANTPVEEDGDDDKSPSDAAEERVSTKPKSEVKTPKVRSKKQNPEG